jgi:hypothetical protein
VSLVSSSEGAAAATEAATEAATAAEAATEAIAAAMAAAATVAATAVTEEEAATDITTARTCIATDFPLIESTNSAKFEIKKVSF